MKINTNPLLSLFILMLTCVYDVFTTCSRASYVSTVTGGFDSSESTTKPSARFVLDTYFQNNVITDKCFSTKVVNMYRIRGSMNTISGGSSPEFQRIFYGSDRDVVYSSRGLYFIRSSSSTKSYISYTAKGAPVNKPFEGVTGRLYILKIEPPPRYNYETSEWTADKEWNYGGSVIVYYSCLEHERTPMDSVYVSQTPIKKDSSRAKRNLENIDTNRISLPNTARPITCY